MNLLYKAQTRFLFHAHIKIKVSAFYKDDIFDELYEMLEHIDKTYNSYQPDSYFDLINKNAGSFVEVDDETIKILEQIIFLSDFFDGQYDITIMPLIRLWGFYKQGLKTVPHKTDIDKVKQLVNYKSIEIDGNRVLIAKGQELITGSFIKAFAVDKLAEKMEEWNINDAIINAGGSTIRAINNESHPDWQINVKNTQDDSFLYKLSVNNKSYSTSSQAKTFVDINGRHYGHILNPKTGYPSENKQIGVISDSSIIGDIVSTALYNQTIEGFCKKISALSKIYPLEGFIMDADDRIAYSPNFESYIIEKAL